MLRLINNFVRQTNYYHSNKISNLNRKILDFDDCQTAYSCKSSRELIRSIVVLKLCSYPKLINNNKIILEWMQKVFGKRIFDYLMESTFYGQFVAGKNEIEVENVIKTNRRYGVKPILDFSVEDDLKEKEDVCLTQYSIDKKFIPFSDEDVSNPQSKSVGGRYFNDQFQMLESQCDRHLQVKLKSIDTIAKFTNPLEAFVAIKISALGRPQLLLQLSEMLIERENIFNVLVNDNQHMADKPPATFRTLDLKHLQNLLLDVGIQINTERLLTLLDTNNDQRVDLFDWSSLIHFKHDLISYVKVKNRKTDQSSSPLKTLTDEGLESLRLMLQRLNRIAEYAREKKVKVLVDAEQSYFQPAIRRLALEMMKEFNSESVLIHNTYQCYSKNALQNVTSDLYFSKHQPFNIGFKLVRGAYLEQERERAISLGYPDPILPDFEATTEMYINCLNAVLNEVVTRKAGQVGVMVASHNEDTVHYALNKMKDMNIKPNDGAVYFGQLMGMCDHLTYPLGLHGYSVYKVVPYGPISNVLPFLSRRALENRSIFQKVQKQNILLRKELWRRSTSGFWNL